MENSGIKITEEGIDDICENAGPFFGGGLCKQRNEVRSSSNNVRNLLGYKL